MKKTNKNILIWLTIIILLGGISYYFSYNNSPAPKTPIQTPSLPPHSETLLNFTSSALSENYTFYMPSNVDALLLIGYDNYSSGTITIYNASGGVYHNLTLIPSQNFSIKQIISANPAVAPAIPGKWRLYFNQDNSHVLHLILKASVITTSTVT